MGNETFVDCVANDSPHEDLTPHRKMGNETFVECVANDSPPEDLHGAGDPTGGVFSNVSKEVAEFLFKKDTLDRRLKLQHLAGKFLRIY
jgi:hypothetical protein